MCIFKYNKFWTISYPEHNLCGKKSIVHPILMKLIFISSQHVCLSYRQIKTLVKLSLVLRQDKFTTSNYDKFRLSIYFS